jgi:hypothetical protein
VSTGENALGALEHGLDFPQGVVEIETDRAHGFEFHDA